MATPWIGQGAWLSAGKPLCLCLDRSSLLVYSHSVFDGHTMSEAACHVLCRLHLGSILLHAVRGSAMLSAVLVDQSWESFVVFWAL